MEEGSPSMCDQAPASCFIQSALWRFRLPRVAASRATDSPAVPLHEVLPQPILPDEHLHAWEASWCLCSDEPLPTPPAEAT